MSTTIIITIDDNDTAQQLFGELAYRLNGPGCDVYIETPASVTALVDAAVAARDADPDAEPAWQPPACECSIEHDPPCPNQAAYLVGRDGSQLSVCALCLISTDVIVHSYSNGPYAGPPVDETPTESDATPANGIERPVDDGWQLPKSLMDLSDSYLGSTRLLLREAASALRTQRRRLLELTKQAQS